MTIRHESNLTNGDNFDTYFVEWHTGLSTKQYTLFVDFERGAITGDVIAYGEWFDIDLDECAKVLDYVTKQGKIRRPFSHLLPSNSEPKDDT